MSELLRLDGVACIRGDRLLFENLSLVLAPGEALWLRGPNGAGKSSLIRLAAGLLRGPLCGALVMLGGGVLGFRLFLSPGGVNQHGAELALMMFWGVSALVLLTANELRVQLKGAMERLSAALQRHGPASR